MLVWRKTTLELLQIWRVTYPLGDDILILIAPSFEMVALQKFPLVLIWRVLNHGFPTESQADVDRVHFFSRMEYALSVILRLGRFCDKHPSIKKRC